MMFRIIQKDVVEACRDFPDNHFSACLCDPPYHLTQESRGGSPRKPGTGPFGRHHLGEKGFFGQTWDGGDIAFKVETWQGLFRVMKPGAYLLAFGGARTFHRLTCAIEDAGFSVINCLCFLYATGMPKNLNIGKKMDQIAGVDRKVIGQYKPPQMTRPWNLKNAKDDRTVSISASSRNNLDITAPATDMAKRWDGYGTSLAPAWEPIIMAMKPMDGSYVDNAEKWGVSGINIDAGRISTSDSLKGGSGGLLSNIRDEKSYPDDNSYDPSPLGRWPKNVILDEESSRMLDDTTQHVGSTKPHRVFSNVGKYDGYGTITKKSGEVVNYDEGDARGASRFFYCAKPSTKERNAGLPDGEKNDHPTLKPISLLRYLASLVLPPSSGVPRRIAVPFSGSGSEIIGALLAGWDEVVGMENGGGDEELAKKYCTIAEQRIKHWTKPEEKDLFD